MKDSLCSFLFALCFFVSALSALFPQCAFAQVATLYSVEGSLSIKAIRSGKWLQVKRGVELFVGDSVRTDSDSRAAIKLSDSTLVRIGQNSSITFKKGGAQDPLAAVISVDYGNVYFLSRKKKDFPIIKTPLVSAALKGTEFLIEVLSKKVTVSVFEGIVECSNSYGTVLVSGGEKSVTEVNQPPKKTLLLEPLDAVQWALYYPKLAESRDYLSISELNQVGRLISIGRIGQAEKLLSKLEASSSSSKIKAGLLAHKAVIALAKNKKKEAESYAKAALELDTSSTMAMLSMSYVAQAFFRLEDAIYWSEQARKQNPNSSLILARLSELYLGQAQNEGALQLAHEALSYEPDNSYALSVLAFSELNRFNLKKAREYFERAIEFDQGFSLPYLGHGLVLIAQGDLESGQAEIEKAVHLAPNVSLYRSYLGKAFFEREQESKALQEYSYAISLDPQDPTPYLYRSYSHLSANRPIAALADIEDSIARNDNRAIYRSRFLLDKDAAIRSAGLVEVFNTLGFSNVAKLEAIKSVNRDYANYSAHLLLGGFFNSQRMFDAARSQFFVANLLAPININALRQTSGGRPSFNEYSALFDRPQTRSSIFARGATVDDSAIFDVVHSTVQDKLGLVARYASINLDGSKDGDYTRDNLFQLEGQYQLTPMDRLSVRNSYIVTDRKLDGGDSPRRVSERESDLEDLTLGYHRKFSYNSHLIAQADYLDIEDDRRLLPSFRRVDLTVQAAEVEALFNFPDELLALDQEFEREDQGWRFMLQHSYDTKLVSLVSGLRYLDLRSSLDEESLIVEDAFLPPFLLEDETLTSWANNKQESYGAYLYSTFHLQDWLDLNLGLNFTSLELAQTRPFDVRPPFVSQTRSSDRFNPKLGISFYLDPQLTLRASYFENQGKLDVDSTGALEPTLVGGINQVFDDAPGAESRNYGVGLDYKLPKKAYIGIEALHRNVRDEFALVDSALFVETVGEQVSLQDQVLSQEILRESVEEDLLTAYFYKVLCDSITFSSDYTFSEVDDDRLRSNNEITTHRIINRVSYYDPSRLFGTLRATWRQQDFLMPNADLERESDYRDFWKFDVELGYLLPQRHGSIVFAVRNVLDRNFDYSLLPSDTRALSDEREVDLRFKVSF